jgi:hypothetical protein
MADGVGLATDIWLPEGNGPFPTLLQRLPYGRAVASAAVLPSPAQLARHGYAVVVQDMRGTGGSGGVLSPFEDVDDGVAAIEWTASQDFSTGDVCTYGFSYQGYTQLQYAARRPRGLRGVAALMCPGDAHGFVYERGVLKQEFATAWAAQLSGLSRQHDAAAFDNAAIPLDSALGRTPPPWFAEWLSHDRPDDYWAARAASLADIEVPLLTVLGYGDVFASASSALVRTTGARVVAGPWVHIPWGTRFGDLELGAEAGPRTAIDALLGFFAEVLQPEADAVAPAPATYYVVGAGWRRAESWPPPASMTIYTAVSGSGANSRHGDGALVRRPAESALADIVVSEPLGPVPGSSAAYADVSAVEDRRDVLCYTTAPLEAGVELAGAPLVRLTAASDTESFDVFASLSLVVDGRSRQLATGAIRIAPGSPDEPVDAEIELSPIGWLVPGGSRLRLDLSATRFPLYSRNPQNPEVAAGSALQGEYRVASVSVRAASVALPLNLAP